MPYATSSVDERAHPWSLIWPFVVRRHILQYPCIPAVRVTIALMRWLIGVCVVGKLLKCLFRALRIIITTYGCRLCYCKTCGIDTIGILSFLYGQKRLVEAHDPLHCLVLCLGLASGNEKWHLASLLARACRFQSLYKIFKICLTSEELCVCVCVRVCACVCFH